jgi:hypothetical protein
MHYDGLIDSAAHPEPRAANTSTKTIDCLQWKFVQMRAGAAVRNYNLSCVSTALDERNSLKFPDAPRCNTFDGQSFVFELDFRIPNLLKRMLHFQGGAAQHGLRSKKKWLGL